MSDDLVSLTQDDVEFLAGHGFEPAKEKVAADERHKMLWAAQERAVQDKEKLDAAGVEYDQIMTCGYLVGVRPRRRPLAAEFWAGRRYIEETYGESS